MDYKTLTDLSTSTLDPGLNNNASELFKERTQPIDLSKIEIIYYNNSGSQSQRSQESANVISRIFSNEFEKDILVEGLPELHEIRFKVSDLVPLEEFEKSGMESLRQALYKAMIKGHSTTETLQEISKRILVVFNKIKLNKEKTVLFVTHDFFMRALEVYIKRPKRLEGVEYNDFAATELNYYFGGFQTDQKMRQFVRWGQPIK